MYNTRYIVAQFLIGFFAFFLLCSGITITGFFFEGLETAYRQTLTSDIVICNTSSDIASSFKTQESIRRISRLEEPDAIAGFVSGLDSVACITRISITRVAVTNKTRSSMDVNALQIDPLTYFKVFNLLDITEGEPLSEYNKGIMISHALKIRLETLPDINPKLLSRLIICDSSLTLASMQEVKVLGIYTSPAELFSSDTLLSNRKLYPDTETDFKRSSQAEPDVPCVNPETAFEGNIIDTGAIIEETSIDDSFFYGIVPPREQEITGAQSVPPVHFICVRAQAGNDIDTLTRDFNTWFKNTGIQAKALTWKMAASTDIETVILPLVLLFFLIILFFILLVSVFHAGHSEAIERALVESGGTTFSKKSRDGICSYSLVYIVVQNLASGCIGICTAILAGIVLGLFPSVLYSLHYRSVYFIHTGLGSGAAFLVSLSVSLVSVFTVMFIETLCILRCMYRRKVKKYAKRITE